MTNHVRPAYRDHKVTIMAGWPEDKLEECYVCDRMCPSDKMRDGNLGRICTSGDCKWEDYIRNQMILLMDDDDELLVYPRIW